MSSKNIALKKSPAGSSSSRRFTRSAPSPADGPNVRKRSRGPASMSKLESGRSKRIKEDDNTSTNDSDNKDSSSEIDPNSDTDPEADVAKASPRKKKKGRSEPKLDKKSLRTHQNVQLASRKDSPESSGEDEPISKKHGNGKPKKVINVRRYERTQIDEKSEDLSQTKKVETSERKCKRCQCNDADHEFTEKYEEFLTVKENSSNFICEKCDEYFKVCVYSEGIKSELDKMKGRFYKLSNQKDLKIRDFTINVSTLDKKKLPKFDQKMLEELDDGKPPKTYCETSDENKLLKATIDRLQKENKDLEDKMKQKNEVQGTDENKKINDQLKELNDEKAEIQAKLQKK